MEATNSISTFNDRLAQAKLAALQILQNLATTLLTRGDKSLDLSRWPGRELRLIAGTILRTRPIDAAPPPRRAPPPDAPPTPSNGVPPATAPASPAGAGPPTDTPPPSLPSPPQYFRARFDPTAIRARRHLRDLVRDTSLPDPQPSHGPAP